MDISSMAKLRYHRRLLGRALSVLVFVLLSACRHASPSPPNVLFIVIDTLRADRLGAYGSSRGLTPFLDELAQRGTLFRNAFAASSWTPPSVASLFTSRLPTQHRIVTGQARLADQEITLAEKLAAQGYTTAGFSANLRLTIKLGFAQGFDHWVHHPLGPIKPRGSVLRKESIAWVDGPCAARRPAPCVVYLQYMEPHAPYQAPEPYRSRFARAEASAGEMAAANRKVVRLKLSDISDREAELLEAAYDAEVAAVDAELRLLFAELEQRRFLDDAIILITADHGEEFKDHGSFSHGSSLYNEVVRVPLILLAPGLRGGEVVEDNVSLIDVAPTILDLLHLPPEPAFEGRSLVPLLRARQSPIGRIGGWLAGDEQATDDALILLELEYGGWVDRRRHTAGVIDGKAKLLLDQRRQSTEVFDLAADPRELAPRPSSDPAATNLAEALAERQSKLQKPRPAAGEKGTVDEGVKEKLRALGYGF
jgi:arylsulfatase A-like enzyme